MYRQHEEFPIHNVDFQNQKKEKKSWYKVISELVRNCIIMNQRFLYLLVWNGKYKKDDKVKRYLRN